ncbi:MAG: CBS domain-containing protein [Chloroflexi bacterium]|nr:CBS domain-containing protein [Chloroflexota bacterium]
MATVKHLIETKTDETNYSIEATASVLEALKLMAEANIGALMVTEDNHIIGIFTERDYARKGELLGYNAKDTRVKELMTGAMYTVTMDTSMEQCMALMQKHRIRHLPVVEKNQLVGMVAMRDVMAAALTDRETEIKGLENYILASGFEN